MQSIKSIECQVGGGECNNKIPRLNLVRSDDDVVAPTTKTKRKARSTRRRLNAMMSNASLHFSDTDSEGELQVPRASTPTNPAAASKHTRLYTDANSLHPTISVTLDPSGDESSCASGDRRGSFLDNLTDVDEIYTSEPDNASEQPALLNAAPCNALQQGETDYEDMSQDENDETPIYVEPRGDILVDLAGETITTKEGDGPFSVEIRNQMSIDEGKLAVDGARASTTTTEIEVVPTTDSEEMEASGDDERLEGACGPRYNVVDEMEILAASQIVMKNVDKMGQLLLGVKDNENGLSDAGGHTDVEDLE